MAKNKPTVVTAGKANKQRERNSKKTRNQIAPPQGPQKKSQRGKIMEIVASPTRSHPVSQERKGALSREIALSITLPHNYPAVRFPSTYNSRPTALSNPFSYNVSKLTASGLDSSKFFFGAVSRSPLQFYVHWKQNVNFQNGANLQPQTYVYEASAPVPSVSTGALLQYAKWFQIETAVSTGPISVPLNYEYFDALPYNMTYTSAFDPHGPMYYAVDADSRKGMFHNMNETVGFANVSVLGIPITPPPGSYIAQYQFIGNEWVYRTAVEMTLYPADGRLGWTAGAANWLSIFNITQPGYYSYTFNMTGPGSTQSYKIACRFGMIFNYSGNANYSSNFGPRSAFGIQPMPGISDKIDTIGAVRVSGVSLLASNTTPELYKGGTIVGYQPDEGRTLGDILEETDRTYGQYAFDLNDAVQKPISTGMYAFHYPTGVHNFDAVPLSRSRAVYNWGINNPLQPLGGWLTITGVPTLDSALGNNSVQMAFVASAAVEFQTPDLWYLVEKSATTQREWDYAVEVLLKQVMQYEENPLHFRDILSRVTSAARKAAVFAPRIIKALGMFVPGANSLQPLADELGKLAM